jgi:hypothetical protein
MTSPDIQLSRILDSVKKGIAAPAEAGAAKEATRRPHPVD